MRIHTRALLLALGLALALGGYGRTAGSVHRAPEPPAAASPAPLTAPLAAALLDDALQRVLPQLSGPRLPSLIDAVRRLALALKTPGHPEVIRAADQARDALAAFEAGPGRYYAIDLDGIRLAIGAAGPHD